MSSPVSERTSSTPVKPDPLITIVCSFVGEIDGTTLGVMLVMF